MQRFTFTQLHIFCWILLKLVVNFALVASYSWILVSPHESRSKLQCCFCLVVWVSVSHVCHMIPLPQPEEVWQIRLSGSHASVSKHCHLVVILEELMPQKQQRCPALPH